MLTIFFLHDVTCGHVSLLPDLVKTNSSRPEGGKLDRGVPLITDPTYGMPAYSTANSNPLQNQLICKYPALKLQ